MTENTNMSEVIEEIKGASEEDLKKVIEEHFEAMRVQGMKIGATYISAAISGVIDKNLKKGLNSSLRDYQRAIKGIVEIVSVQLKHSETVQNDSEKAERGIEDASDEQ